MNNAGICRKGMKNVNILVLESSTTSAKGMLFDTETGNYVMESLPFTQDEDSTLQDADTVYQQTMAVGRKIAAGRKVDIIVLSGAWHSVMLTDEKKKPVTPVYVWSNTQASPLCRKLRKDEEFTSWYYHRTGCMVSAIYPSFKLMMMGEEGEDFSGKYIMGQGTYNTYRLTGEYVVLDSMASGSGLMNTHTVDYDDEILDFIGIKRSQLGRIVSYKDTFPLTREAAITLGLQEGIPVIPSGADGGFNQVGARAIENGIMTFSVGTSGAIRLSSDKPMIPLKPSTWCYRSPYKWLSGAATSGAANCVDWFKKKMFEPGTTYEQIEKGYTGKEEIPVFLPFLFGERSPGWEDGRFGGFMGLKPEHTRYDMYQAVLEGVLFNLYQCYEVISDIYGIPEKVMLSGGILHSDHCTKLCVDLFNIPMTVSKIEHSSLMGGVYLGAELLGVKLGEEKYDVLSDRMIYPDVEAHRKIKRRYLRYLNLYNATSMEVSEHD